MDDNVLRKLAEDVAKKELREDKSSRRQSLEQFRNWIEKNPDIRGCRTDDTFLLAFLRKGKFCILKAQKIFLKCASFCENNSHITRNIDIMNPKISMFISNGYSYMVPSRTEQGCRVMICQYCRFDPHASSYIDRLKAMVAGHMTLLEDEATQVLGLVIVIDASNITAAHATHIPIAELLVVVRAMQHAIPTRFKGIHFVNVPPVCKGIVDLVFSTISRKMSRRFFFHTKKEDLYEYIDRKILPKEFGGDIQESVMIDLWYKEIQLQEEKIALYNQLGFVPLQGANLRNNIASLMGIFRKLDVD